MKTKLFLIALVMILAACAPGGAPQLIGSAPHGGEGGLPPINNPPPTDLAIVYNASMELAVRNVSFTVERVRDLASEMNGYTLTEHTWQSGFEQLAELSIAVPAHQVEQTLKRLRRFGSVRSESKSGQLVAGDGYTSGFSTITITLRPDWWAGAADLMGWLLLLLAVITPPVLMLVGAVTVIGWVKRWLDRDRRAV